MMNTRRRRCASLGSLSVTGVAATLPSYWTVLAVAAGGAVGASLRFVVITSTAGWLATFPIGTLLVNSVGCLIAGLIYPWVAAGSGMQALLLVGFCGGLTTMSAFGIDLWALLDGGRYGYAGLYCGATLLLGLIAVVVGIECSRLLLRH